MRSRMVIGTMFAVCAAAVVSAANFSFSGTLAGGQATDFVVTLNAGDSVVATLVCDELSPANRPVDPFLSVNDPANNFVTQADDNFGSGDGGVDCNAFNSAQVTFVAELNGQYTFQATNLQPNAGPFTLAITTTPGNVVPTAPMSFVFALGALLTGAGAWYVSRRRTQSVTGA